MWIVTKDKVAEKGEPTRVGYGEVHNRIPAGAFLLGFQNEVLPVRG